MRTINEITELVNHAADDYKQRVEAAQQEYNETMEALNQAKTAAEKAAEAGDKAAFDQAKQSEAFYSSRAEYLKKVTVSQYFTPQEHNALVQELQKASDVECAPYYQNVVEAFQKLKEALDCIKETKGRAASAAWKMRHSTGEPLTGRACAGYMAITYGIPVFLTDTCSKFAAEKERLAKLAAVKGE